MFHSDILVDDNHDIDRAGKRLKVVHRYTRFFTVKINLEDDILYCEWVMQKLRIQ